MRDWTDEKRREVLCGLLSPEDVIRHVKQYGDYEPIQWMFRANQTDKITSMMNDYPEFSEIVADALAGKFVGAKGNRKARGLKKEERDHYLLKQIHYWIDQGLIEWDETNDNNAIAKATQDMIDFIDNRNHFLKWSIIAPASVYKHVWLKRKSFEWYVEKYNAGIYDLHNQENLLRKMINDRKLELDDNQGQEIPDLPD